MVSAFPPRPVSANSLATVSVVPPTSPGKTARSMSARVPDRYAYEDPMSSSDPRQSHPCPATAPASTIVVPGRVELQFVNLPMEIHELILDYLFGKMLAATPGRFPVQNWSKALRHPRRKALSNLALICRLWTKLVQSRIYRHSEL